MPDTPEDALDLAIQAILSYVFLSSRVLGVPAARILQACIVAVEMMEEPKRPEVGSGPES
jgi:hypothetical protein